MKKGSVIVCLLLVVIVAVFISFYYSEQEQFETYGFKLFGESGATAHNSPYVSCSSYTPDKCPTKNCLVITDDTRCAGNAEPSNLTPGSMNYDVPSSSYMNDGGPAPCGTAGYLKTCVTRSLQ